MSEEIISFIDFTVMSDEEKYKLLNIRDNRISSLNIVNEELEYKLQQKENTIKEVREKLNTQLAFTSSYQLNYQSAMIIIEEAKQMLDKENKQ